MDRPFGLVPDNISHDTVEALKELHGAAGRGEVIGIAFAVMYKGRDYIVDAAGECYRSPTFTRGMVQALDDKLEKMVHGI